MGVYNQDQKKQIIFTNPQKELVHHGQQTSKKLMMHLYGIGIKDAMTREDYFENADIYKARTEKPVSNMDLFERVLGQEEMVFTARGGTCSYGMSDKQEIDMNKILDNVRYGQSLREWVKNFALSAYRGDPMGVIFMETAQQFSDTNEADPTSDFRIVDLPPVYPTYKSIQNIFDYLPNGRRLEYVVFQLTVKEIIDYGIEDTELVNYPENAAAHGRYPKERLTPYFRFVDDKTDEIWKKGENTLLVPKMKQDPIVTHPWNICPAIVASNLIFFAKPRCFASPLHNLVEIADCFMYDRSIRDMQKRYHGFAKAIEPLLKCPTCSGTGQAKGSACPDCTPNGQNVGSGYKIKTKVSDVSKFPLDIFEGASGFDFKKVFGYVTPDIESWRQQDLSLDQLEQLIYYTYWGTRRDPPTTPGRTTGVGGALEETATKTLANLQPKYARLNKTADWAQQTENWIADMMGEYYFPNGWGEASITYGRNYVLESLQDLLDQYYDARDNGMSEVILDDMLEKVIRCEYSANSQRMEYFLKLIQVEPFPHLVKDDAKGIIPKPEDWQQEVYYRDWAKTLTMGYVLATDVPTLQAALEKFIEDKDIQPPPVPPVAPPAPLPGAQEKQDDAIQGEHGKKEQQAAAAQA